MKGSWKTTLSGILLAFGLGSQSAPVKNLIPNVDGIGQISAIVGALLLGAKSKDADVTGGTRTAAE